MRTPKRKNHPKGFTLMELLVVVAIIAVLIAIAIPVFSANLEKSREATNAANIRSDYAQAVAQFILPSEGTETTATQEQMLSVVKEPTIPGQSKPVVENVKFSDDPAPPAVPSAETGSAVAEHIHTWGDISYTWSAETGVCTAEKRCKNCPAVLRYTSTNITVQLQTEATCTEEGSALLTVIFEDASLNTSLSVTLPKIDHVPADPEVVVITDSTCTAEGSGETVFRCVNCKNEIKPREPCTIPMKDHVPADPEVEVITDSTCTTEGRGKTVFRCFNCKNEIRESEPCTIPMKDHVPGEPVVEKKTAGTCIEKGSYENVVYCKNCTTELSRQKVDTDIVPENHVGEQVTFWSNTLNENGEYPWQQVCMSCGATIASGSSAENDVPWDSLDNGNDGPDRWIPEEQEEFTEGE